MTDTALNLVQSLLYTGDLLQPQGGALAFSAGSKLFEEGDGADCAYMIDSGYVEISKRTECGKKVLAVLGPGEIVGEMALIDGLQRAATATAMHETTAVVIPRQDMWAAINEASPIVRLILMAAMRRLRGTQSPDVNWTDEIDDPLDPQAGLNPYYDATRLTAANQLRARVALEAAIRNNEFELAYQPIVSLIDGRTNGFEALIRWPNPNGQAVSPGEFVPLAEMTGLILPLGAWVLKEALLALKSLDRILEKRGKGDGNVFMSVNVSPRQLESDENVEHLAKMLEQPDVDSSRVKLEITEQALLCDPKKAMVSLSRLKATGASLAIDDFGTGYSSLSYLHQFPLDTMKIDRSFIYRLTNNPGGQRVVAAIIALAHELGMDVVAEGIENASEVQWLQSHSCRYGQGYLMAKPAPLSTAVDYLDRHFEW